ncbi:hypothetical protein D9Q98_002910 [Chlorella vulgaris]|uniref:Uncharacterized protein n=1 Tax=Chlorella vulgaris TaxID=3077 RepID=A0A9D4YZW8_CHLVU|nr:hypothetical protein D9Q98_002910 [Chlorella vulgaris]
MARLTPVLCLLALMTAPLVAAEPSRRLLQGASASATATASASATASGGGAAIATSVAKAGSSSGPSSAADAIASAFAASDAQAAADAVTKAITGGQASAAAQAAAQAVNQSSAAASSTATALVQGFAQALQQNPSQALQSVVESLGEVEASQVAPLVDNTCSTMTNLVSEALDGGDLPTAARLIAAVLIQAGACADDVTAQLSGAAGSAGCERVMDAVQQAYQVAIQGNQGPAFLSAVEAYSNVMDALRTCLTPQQVLCYAQANGTVQMADGP